MREKEHCVFCRNILDGPGRTLLAATEHVVAFEDAYPSAVGHTLVIPRRHVGKLLDLGDAEYHDLFDTARSQLRRLDRPGEGFTVGINDGAVAGQTVPHVHLHIIPRRHGDTSQARGGVRWVLPHTAAYWERNSST